MRKLARVFAGVLMFGTMIALVPAPQAVADHDCGAGAVTNGPCPKAGKGLAGDNLKGWHEEMPDIAVAAPEVACQVSGSVLGGDAPTPPLGHDPFPPAGIDDPAHSHFVFLDTLITCSDGAVSAIADGGNDGHVLPWQGGATENDGAGVNCAGEHGYNKHHGAMTESGWSHSSGYSGGSATCPAVESNDGCPTNSPPAGCTTPRTGVCTAPVAPASNNNRADITINGEGGAPNWVKYVRLGNMVYFWGCSNAFDNPASYSAPFERRFSGHLAILPDPLDPEFPICVVPGGAGCNLILAGSSVRSRAWLINNRP